MSINDYNPYEPTSIGACAAGERPQLTRVRHRVVWAGFCILLGTGHFVLQSAIFNDINNAFMGRILDSFCLALCVFCIQVVPVRKAMHRFFLTGLVTIAAMIASGFASQAVRLGARTYGSDPFRTYRVMLFMLVFSGLFIVLCVSLKFTNRSNQSTRNRND